MNGRLLGRGRQTGSQEQATTTETESSGPTRADELLANASPVLLDPDHRRRANEAGVHRLELLNEIVETAATQADNDRNLRAKIVNRVLWAITVQVLLADAGFGVYAFENHWHFTGGVLNVWLGATVIQVFSVGLVIARSLFPAAGVNATMVTEALRAYDAHVSDGSTKTSADTSKSG